MAGRLGRVLTGALIVGGSLAVGAAGALALQPDPVAAPVVEGPAVIEPRTRVDPAAVRRAAVVRLAAEHGVAVKVTDFQACTTDAPPFVSSDGSWATAGCYRDGDDFVELSDSALDPRVPWSAAEYLVLHESGHYQAWLAGCPAMLTEDQSEKLADAYAVLSGAAAAEQTYGANVDDFALARLVIAEGRCI